MMSVFYRWLALSYANYHADMADPNKNPCREGDRNFGKDGGITNGAKWYSVQGGKVLSKMHRYIIHFLFQTTLDI